MRRIVKIDQQNPSLFVYWHLTDFCNYKCNYCPSFLNAGWYATGKKSGFPTNNEIDLFIDRLTEISKTRNILLVLSGGEPTVHEMFPEIIKRTKLIGKVGIVSNGSRTLNWWKKLSVLPDFITISLHPEYADMEHINQLSEYLIEQGVVLTYNLSVDPANWDMVLDMHNKLDSKFKFRIRYKILNDFSNGSKKTFSYTDTQLSWVRNNYDEKNELFTLNEEETTMYYDDGSIDNRTSAIADLTIDSRHNFYNWKCSAGSNGIKVNVDGNVYAGICSAEQIGHLTNFNLLTDLLTCKINYCVCPGDIRLPKYDPSYT